VPAKSSSDGSVAARPWPVKCRGEAAAGGKEPPGAYTPEPAHPAAAMDNSDAPSKVSVVR
jgi:hypothetical protein